jgi:hypothetical protein
MTLNHFNRLALITLLVILSIGFAERTAAQDRGEANVAARDRADTNYEVRLHLLVASNDAAEGSGLPTELQPIISQLRSSLPFRNYVVGATFINRVRDGGNLEVKGVSNSFLTNPAFSNPSIPQFFDFSLGRVRAEADGQGRDVIQISSFRFGARVPIQTATTGTADGKGGFPIINYEPVGLTTTISMREGAPILVGTLPTNRTDQIMVLAAQIKRTDAR